MNNAVSERRIRNNKRMRRRQMRNNFMRILFTFFLIACISVTFFGLHAKAQTSEEVSYKYYKSIIASRGDTLWGYAEQYAEPAFYKSYDKYISEVKSINHLTDDRIQSGQHIIVPYYSSDFR